MGNSNSSRNNIVFDKYGNVIPNNDRLNSGKISRRASSQSNLGNLLSVERQSSNRRSWASPADAPPPAYDAVTAPISSTSRSHVPTDPKDRLEWLRTPLRQGTLEDALEMLRKYDTVIIVDDSASMRGSRWAEASHALSALADTASKYDADGLDLHFLNSPVTGTGIKSSNAVEKLFNSVQPYGATPIGEKLEELLLSYIAIIEKAQVAGPSSLKTIKPVNFIVLTDGAPTDDPEPVIVSAARRLDQANFPLAQVGIQFVQIGNDRKATAYLQELDDGLGGQHGIRDIVDTTPYLGCELTAEVLTKVLIGGINRRVDRKAGGVFNKTIQH